MDKTTRQIVSYVRAFSESDLTVPIIDAVVDRLIDSMGCIIAGYDSEPARIAVRLAQTVSSQPDAIMPGNQSNPSLV